MKSTDTIYDLKLLYEEEEGIVPNHQTYFCGPVAIESDKILVFDLLEYNNTFDVKLQKAATLKTDKDVTVLYGPTRNDFQKLYLSSGGSKKVEFKKGKFGIVTSTRTIGEERVYTVQRYKLPSDKEQNAEMQKAADISVLFFQLVLIFGPFWIIFGPFWQFRVIFGPIWAMLGHFFSYFG